MQHGIPYYLLSDQRSNVDGLIINDLCKTLGIDKRRTPAYHSQCNGFAERNLRNVREILRIILLDRNVAPRHWRRMLPEVTFSLANPNP